jgi:hypothetical protein
MKTQLSKPARSKASYTNEYKQQALELLGASRRSAAKVATPGIGIVRVISSERETLATFVFPLFGGNT